MIGSSTQKTNATTTSQPWTAAQPGLNQILGASSSWLTNDVPNLSYFTNSGLPGSTGSSSAATLTPAQQQGISAAENIANQGTSPVVSGAQGLESNVLGGQYLNAGNPNQAALNTAITNATLPAINATFSNAGRTGSGLNQYAVSSGLGAALAQPRYQNYQYEQGLQQQAAGQATPLAEGSYIAPTNLYNAGGLTQAQNQQQLNSGLASWQYNQMAPLMGAQGAAGLTTPIGGLGSTQNTAGTTQTTPNLFTSLLGGAGGLASLFNPGTGGTSAAGNIGSGASSGLSSLASLLGFLPSFAI